MLSQFYATIDLGSNSFHLLTAELSHDEIKILGSDSERVMLAEGLSKASGITNEAMQRGIDCIHRFSEKLNVIPKKNIRIVGTNTLRAAVNSRRFVEKLENILQVEIEIVSGMEEARLVYLGVNHSWSSIEPHEKKLVIDIGGGSTEFIVGTPFKLKTSASLRMGCIGYRRFFPDDIINLKFFNQAVKAARFELNNLQDSTPKRNWKFAVGSAGTFKAIENILKELNLTHEGITYSALKKLKIILLKFNHMDKLNVTGLKSSRQKSILPGLAIAIAIFETLNLTEMHISKGGLREGILYDLLGRVKDEDIRLRSVNAIRRRYHANLQHAKIMSKTASNLTGLLTCNEKFKLDKANIQLIEWATQTCQIGLAINHSQYQIHSSYLLEHSQLNGFSLKDHQLLAWVVLNHRRKLNFDLFSELPLNQRQKSSLITVILIVRLSYLLSQGGKVEKIKNGIIWLNINNIKISIPEKWLQKRPLVEHALELEKKYWLKAGLSYQIINLTSG